MNRRYLFFTLFLVGLRTLTLGAPAEHALYDHQMTVASLTSTEDPEVLLTFNRRIPFSLAGMYELELIPRISDTLADKIERKRHEIVIEAAKLPSSEAWKAFERVKGIGPETARKLGRYLDLDR